MNWQELPQADRVCVFLGQMGECRAYEAPPSVCRKYLVLDTPKHCDKIKLYGDRVLRWAVPEAVLSAAMTFKRHGAMPDMLAEALAQQAIEARSASTMKGTMTV